MDRTARHHRRIGNQDLSDTVSGAYSATAGIRLVMEDSRWPSRDLPLETRGAVPVAQRAPATKVADKKPMAIWSEASPLMRQKAFRKVKAAPRRNHSGHAQERTAGLSVGRAARQARSRAGREVSPPGPMMDTFGETFWGFYGDQYASLAF
jgi:hypothetical protein